MIKGIMKTPIVRNLAIGSMFAGAVMAGQAAKPVSNPMTESPLQEQLLSSDASKALAAVALFQSSDDVRNKEIENKIMALSENEAERKDNKAAIDYLYSNFGLYFTAAALQTDLCNAYFKKAMDSFNKAEQPILRRRVENNPTQAEKDEYWERTVASAQLGQGYKIGDYFCEVLDGSVYNLKYYYDNTWVPFRQSYMNAILSGSSGKPTAKQVSDGLDKLEQSVTFFTAEEHKRYNNEVKAYEEKLTSSNVDQSNLIAFKVFLIDRMVIERNIKDFRLLDGNRHLMITLEMIYDDIKPLNEAQSCAPKFSLE